MATLEAEKARWEKEQASFLLEVNKLKKSKNETIDQYENLDKKDDVFWVFGLSDQIQEQRNEVETLMKEINEMKTRKNSREDELLEQLDTVGSTSFFHSTSSYDRN